MGHKWSVYSADNFLMSPKSTLVLLRETTSLWVSQKISQMYLRRHIIKMTAFYYNLTGYFKLSTFQQLSVLQCVLKLLNSEFSLEIILKNDLENFQQQCDKKVTLHSTSWRRK